MTLLQLKKDLDKALNHWTNLYNAFLESYGENDDAVKFYASKIKLVENSILKVKEVS